jgi:RNA polymerase sigma-70 factor (ECF subfamily)
MSDIRQVLSEQTPRLRRYAVALTRNPDQADDLVEDTLREAIAQGMTRDLNARDGTALRIWLLTILHEQHDNPFRLATPGAAPYNPDLDPSARATLSRFDHALGRLPVEQRAPILLIGLEGMTYDATAEILGVPVGTMRARLLRGRETLARAMATPEIRRAEPRGSAPRRAAPRRRARAA